jgi:hypothetical protein
MEVAVAKEHLERKNTEAATLKRQNTAVSARLKASTAVVDNDIMDEAAGQARIAAAAASEERRKNEQTFMQKRNKDMRDRVRRAGSIARSDDNIDDEAAGIARIAMREASLARRAAERKELARANAAQRAVLAATQAVTDFSIDDDEAGRYRAVKADEARVRREREAEQLKQHALSTRARILAVKAVTDVDLTDEATHRWRLELATASAAQQLENRERLAQKNAQMRRALASARPRALERACTMHRAEVGLASHVSEQAMAESLAAVAAAKLEVAKAKELLRTSLLSDQTRIWSEAYARRAAPASLW